jgi:DNA mismatch repair ATPase MutS
VGGMVRAVLNYLFFYDFHVGEAVLARIASGRDTLLRGLSAMAELEALASLACFAAEQPVACYPWPASETMLEITEGRHPLIPATRTTSNNIRLGSEHRTWVITGPNAAGKSTFLRMVGINLLMAQVGGAAAAEQMRWSPMRLMTDVRIRDDMAKHESYFLAEVRRLRRMVLDADRQAPILGLIDEPFRGTNSQEKVAAGVATLEHLIKSPNLFVVATHEEALAQTAAKAPSAENHHFQEHLTDAGIQFDYRLYSGPASTKTALCILEREGYPEDLLERARGLMPG